jgi:hypothetical protein
MIHPRSLSRTCRQREPPPLTAGDLSGSRDSDTFYGGNDTASAIRATSGTPDRRTALASRLASRRAPNGTMVQQQDAQQNSTLKTLYIEHGHRYSDSAYILPKSINPPRQHSAVRLCLSIGRPRILNQVQAQLPAHGLIHALRSRKTWVSAICVYLVG